RGARDAHGPGPVHRAEQASRRHRPQVRYRVQDPPATRLHRPAGPRLALLVQEHQAAPASISARGGAMASDAGLLAAVPLFKALRAAGRAALAASLEKETHPAGQTLFNFGDPGGSMYIIRSGEIEVFFRNVTGEQIVLERAGPGAFIGEI